MPLTTALIAHALPACPNARLALFAIRRTGAYGLADASAAHALFTGFGADFRRPLILLRAMMAEVAGTAEGTIAIAPCCCARMTAGEDALLTAIAAAEVTPGRARLLLADLLGVRRVDGVVASVAAVAAAFADAGRPIGR